MVSGDWGSCGVDGGGAGGAFRGGDVGSASCAKVVVCAIPMQTRNSPERLTRRICFMVLPFLDAVGWRFGFVVLALKGAYVWGGNGWLWRADERVGSAR